METKFRDLPTHGRQGVAPPTPPPVRGILREVVVVCLILAALIPAIWLSFVTPSEKTGSSSEKDKQVMRDLSLAKAQFDRDFLTWPQGENALESYARILNDDPNNLRAQRGIEAVGNRLLVLLDRHLQFRDIPQAYATLQSAERVQPFLRGQVFETDLVAARQQLTKLQDEYTRQLQQQTQTPEPLTILRDRLADGTLGPEMIVLAGGTFIQGSPTDESERDIDEGPQVEITLPPFALGRTEVTFAEYELFAQATNAPLPDDNGWGRGNMPVINISWLEAKAYAAWLSGQTGFHYRLPTESEWEYAARAGTTGTFYTGPCLSATQANIDARLAYADCPTSEQIAGRTLPVGSFPANPWGLHDMLGNVREMTEDCWLPSYQGKPANGWPTFTADGCSCGPGNNRVVRGGTWNAPVKNARAANRFGVKETEIGPTTGLRLVRSLL
jgi:formylglycine-generating enzyme required for sulfatase activity